MNTTASAGATLNGPVRVYSLTTGVDGTTNVNGGSISTAGAQGYGNAVVLGMQNATFAGSSVTFNGGISGQQALNVNTTGSGTKTFGGPVDVLEIVTNSSGTTRIGANITTTDRQECHDDVTLTTDTTLRARGVEFFGTASGNYALTVKGNPSCTLSACSDFAAFHKSVNIASLTTSVSGSTQIRGDSVTTKEPQTYNHDLRAYNTKNLTLNGAGVTFGGSVQGYSLTVNTTGGAPIVFDGTVLLRMSTWSSLSTNDGVTDLNGGSVTTLGSQTYNNNVVLSADAVLQGAPVTFNGTVTKGPYALTVNSTGGPATSSTAATSLKSLAPLLRPSADSDVLLFANGRAAVAAETDRSARADLRQSASIASTGEATTASTDAMPRIRLPACVVEQRNGADCAH